MTRHRIQKRKRLSSRHANKIALGTLAGLIGAATLSFLKSRGDEAINGVASFSRAGRNLTPGKKLLILGSIGGLLGAAAVALLSQKGNGKIHQNGSRFAAYESLKSNNWMDTAKDVFNTLSEKKHELTGRRPHSTLEEIADWAAFGLDVWQNLKKKG